MNVWLNDNIGQLTLPWNSYIAVILSYIIYIIPIIVFENENKENVLNAGPGCLEF